MKNCLTGFTLLIFLASASFISIGSPAYAAEDLEKGIVELAKKIAASMTDNQRRKIAIIEFSDLDGNVPAFGQFLAEELITQLFTISPGQFEVVERRQLMKVLGEQKLTMSGLFDKKTMGKVGQILGIDAIVTGSLTDLGNDIKINARLIGIDPAKIFAVASTKIPKVGTVKGLMEKMSAPIQPLVSHSSGGAIRSIPTPPAVTSSANLPKTNKPFQDFSEFRVEVQDLKEIQTNKIAISLRYINKTNKTFHFALVNGVDLDDFPSFAVDEQNRRYLLKRVSGIRNIETRRHGGGGSPLPLTLKPKFPSTVSFILESRNSRDNPSTSYLFSSAQIILESDENGNLKKDRKGNLTAKEGVNISISNIRLEDFLP